MQVSVRELKNGLSKYLRIVKNGEIIEVTSYRMPLARLMPIPQPEETGLRRLMTMDGVHRNGGKPHGGRLCPSIAGKTVAQRVLEDRR